MEGRPFFQVPASHHTTALWPHVDKERRTESGAWPCEDRQIGCKAGLRLGRAGLCALRAEASHDEVVSLLQT